MSSLSPSIDDRSVVSSNLPATAVPPLTEQERQAVAPYVTELDQPIFALKNLPEEVVAVLFAYYSRSREPLRHNLARLLAEGDLNLLGSSAQVDSTEARSELPASGALAHAAEKARAFHEKWVVGYGHASVAEHGVVHLALEDVSILASKVIEDARLASFTEKSTRYVQFDRSRYHRPRAILESRYAQRYLQTADALFDAYTELMPTLQQRLKGLYPLQPGQTPRAWENALRAKTCDVLRYLLPASTLTNIGLTANGRTLEHLISRLLSEPQDELKIIGQTLKVEAQKVLPTLVKYAAYNPYRAQTGDALDALVDRHFREVEARPARSVGLIRFDPEAELELVAALLYPYTRVSLAQLREEVRKFSPEQRAHVLEEGLKRRGPHDAPLRALEHVSYTFDLLVDFGAYRDIQRHRMATQQAQPITVEHGYEVPEELEVLDMTDRFERLMDQAASCYRLLVGSLPYDASYVVPLAFRRRVVFTWNLREAMHFIELRSAPQGHRSYRRVAMEIFRQIEKVHPFIARFIRVHLEEVGLERLGSEERILARQGRES